MVDVAYRHTLSLEEPLSERVPLRIGVPFPRGEFTAERGLAMSTKTVPIPCQFRPLMHWPDKSVQWALIDWLGVPGEHEYFVELVPKTVSQSQITVSDTGSASLCERPVANGSLAGPVPHLANVGVGEAVVAERGIVIGPLTTKFEAECAGGRQLSFQATGVREVDRGPVRRSIWIEGVLSDSSGRELLQVFCHMHWFQDSGLQRWSLTLRNPRAALHPGGVWELGDPNSVSLKSATLEFSHRDLAGCNRGFAKSEIVDPASWQPFERSWRLAQFGSGGENYRSRIHRDATGDVRIPFNGYRLKFDDEEQSGRRATPALVVGQAETSMGFFCDRFWQNFPHALAAADGRIRFELFPHDFGATHELQPGEQKTYEFWLAAGVSQATKKWLDQLRCLPKVRLDAVRVSEANVLPHLTPESEDANKSYLQLVHQAVDGDDSFFAKRDRIDMYGWRHFGDVYGDHEAVDISEVDPTASYDPENPLVSHYNNQYDVVLGLGIQALRSGDARFGELMRDLARHVVDIDIYHTDEDRPAYNHGQFWHTVHYVDAGLSTHRTYPRGTCGGGPSSGQAYSRGILLHYCLTGDETAREVVLKMGRWMIAAEDGSATKYRWLAGGETGLTSASGTEFYHGPGRGPANAVEVLVTAFQLTFDRQYLDQAEHLIRRVVHPGQPVNELNLFDIENRWFYTMFLQSLGRYLDLKLALDELDEMYTYARRVLLTFAEWMVGNEYPYLDKPELLEFPNETWSGQEMRKCEALQWAAKHADGQRQAAYLDKAEFFFNTACAQLLESPRRSLCRPVVLLLTNGYSRNWFQNRDFESMTLPSGKESTFPPRTPFVDQKQRAIRRAKIMAGAGVAGLGVLALTLGYWTVAKIF